MTIATVQLADSQHPWIGLASFTEGDRGFFAGRGEEIDELLRLVRRDILTLLYSVSGLGKTSLLRAGLFPALRARDYLPVPIRLDYLEGTAPLSAQVLDAIIAAAHAARVEVPRPQPDETLWEYLHREGNHFWSSHNDLVTPFLAFDQFEELFTLGRETPERATRTSEFISQLADLVENRPPVALRDDPLRAEEFSFKPVPLNVLLAMREDYLADLYRIRFHFRALDQNRLRLLRMGERQARQVIALGAPLLGPGVEDRIIKLVAGDDDDTEMTIAPALLSLVLRELNERRLVRGPDAKITPDLLDVEQEKIFEDFYLRAIEDFSEGVRTFIEDKLLTTTGFRDSCALDVALSSPDVTQPILNELVSRRLLAYEDRHHTRRVELTHDVLIPVIKTSRDTRLTREALAQAELRARLAQDEKERQQRELDTARKLVETQRERAEAQSKAQRRQRFFIIALGVLLFIAAFVAVFAAQQWISAREVASRADVSLARELKQAGDGARALARLAQALRLNQWNHEAAALASAMLTQTSWPLPLAGPMRHQRPVNSARFSPDGQRIVTASNDKTAQLWNPLNGEPIGEPMRHQAEVYSAQFSPDGRKVVTASEDGSAHVWDAITGKPVGRPMNHEGLVYSAEFSPDGKLVVTASHDDTARLWDAVTGEPIGQPMKHDKDVVSAQFSPDGRRVVTASDDNTARVWDAHTGKPIGQPMKHQGFVTAARFSEDGEWVVTASNDNTARLWDAHTGKPIGEPMKHEDSVYFAQLSPDGQRILTASQDNTARLWDAITGKPIGQPMRHEMDVVSAQFSPEGERVLTASEDGSARLWDAATGNPIGEPMKHETEVVSAEFSPDGQWVLTASYDNTAMLWYAPIGNPTGEPMKHDKPVLSAELSPDGRQIVTASQDNTARLWDATTGYAIGEPLRHEGTVYSARFSPDGQCVVTASGDNTARLWDATTSRPIGEPMKHEGSVYFAQFSPDGQRVLTASQDNTARLWDALTGKPIGQPMEHEDGVYCAHFSPDGKRVVTASKDRTARLWDALTGKPIGQPMKHEHWVYSAQFSSDGQRIVTASRDRTARLWDAATGNPIGQPMKHEHWVYSAQFSPDSQRVVTASKDGTARVWDAATGKPIGQPMQHEGWVYSAQFSPDGQRIVTASRDRTARIWNAATGEPIGGPIEHESWVYSASFDRNGQQILTASQDHTARLWDVPPTGSPENGRDLLSLADLAEATADVAVRISGQKERLNVLMPVQVRATRNYLAAKFAGPSSTLTPLEQLLKWSASEPRLRSLSPFSKRTVADWIEDRIKEGSLNGLRAAIVMYPTNAQLAAHFGRALADFALEKGIDPAEARRARAEADFQMRRALKLGEVPAF